MCLYVPAYLLCYMQLVIRKCRQRPEEGISSPWNWNYRWMSVLKTEPGSSAKAENNHNC